MPLAALPQPVALELVAALIQGVAARSGSRVMIIKGLAAQSQRIRQTGRQSADVDVLVDPASFTTFVEALTSEGWLSRKPSPNRFRVLNDHSITLIHPNWPCDVDAHIYVPGLFQNEQNLFETFWSRRDTIKMGGIDTYVPTVTDHILILIVNALRDPSGSKEQQELANIRKLITQDPSLWNRIQDSARESRALYVIAPFAETLRPPKNLPNDLSPEEIRAWTFRQIGSPDGFWGFLYQLPRLKKIEALSTLIGMTFRPNSYIQRIYPDLDATVWSTLRGNMRRWRKWTFRLIPTLRRAQQAAALTSTDSLPGASASIVSPEVGHTFKRPRGLPTAQELGSLTTTSVAQRTSPNSTLTSPTTGTGDAGTRVHQLLLEKLEFSASSTTACVEENEQSLYLLQTDTPNSSPVRLSGSGPVIWSTLQQAYTMSSLVTHLSESFKVPRSEIEPSIEACVSELIQKSLLTIVQPTEGTRK